MEKKRLIIIDSNALIHRAYHALPPLTTKKGELVNAVYGFFLVFLKVLKDFQPNYVVAVFDSPAPTFRHKEFKEYKAKRQKAPEELYQQIPKVKEILERFNIPIFEKEGFEADDIIGAISKQASRKQIFPEIETIIVTGDLDVLQLVDKNTKIYVLKRGVKDSVLYDQKEVEKKYQGLKPFQVPEVKGLQGDPSDNIPGVPGIGEKNAVKLIKQFGNLENLYQKIEKQYSFASENINISPRLLTVLREYKEQAFLSRELAKIKLNVPIDFNLEKCHYGKYNKEKLVSILKRFEFFSLIKNL